MGGGFGKPPPPQDNAPPSLATAVGQGNDAGTLGLLHGFAHVIGQAAAVNSAHLLTSLRQRN